jgi:peptide/nickel transport system permease protein
MTLRFLLGRIGLFFTVVLTAITINFAIAHSVPGDPIGGVLAQLGSRGETIENTAEIVAEYRSRFGLDEPVLVQYVTYVLNTLRLDLGTSITYFPEPVLQAILRALPWTLALLTMATLIAFVLGSALGAVLAWTGTPRVVKALAPVLMIFSAIPYYLLALILLYLFAVWARWFPLGGGRSIGAGGQIDLSTILDYMGHAFLPALSIVLAGLGFWALSMRGAMINVMGEDYLLLAEAKGLQSRRVFVAYGIRNALLPQVTHLALSLGTIASGSVLVEVAFNYPGIGFLLYDALRGSDYFMIQGICLVLVLTVAIAVLLLDLIYPLIDPRITHR